MISVYFEFINWIFFYKLIVPKILRRVDMGLNLRSKNYKKNDRGKTMRPLSISTLQWSQDLSAVRIERPTHLSKTVLFYGDENLVPSLEHPRKGEVARDCECKLQRSRDCIHSHVPAIRFRSFP
jgi:hypothetical protein